CVPTARPQDESSSIYTRSSAAINFEIASSVLSIPKFAQRPRRMLANFGIGTLAGVAPGAQRMQFLLGQVGPPRSPGSGRITAVCGDRPQAGPGIGIVEHAGERSLLAPRPRPVLQPRKSPSRRGVGEIDDGDQARAS